MELDYKQIGKRIRRYRLARNITQEEMAFQVGTSAAYISNIEQGKKKASLKKLCEISEFLGHRVRLTQLKTVFVDFSSQYLGLMIDSCENSDTSRGWHVPVSDRGAHAYQI